MHSCLLVYAVRLYTHTQTHIDIRYMYNIYVCNSYEWKATNTLHYIEPYKLGYCYADAYAYLRTNPDKQCFDNECMFVNKL